MKRINALPHVITAFGLASGLFVIFKVNMTEPGAGTYQVLYVSALLLLVAAFADLLDGAVARAMNAESDFGFNFDSLADAISFGVAPSVLTLKSLSLQQGTLLSFFVVLGAMFYSIAAVLRLVRFNVQSKEAKGDAHLVASQKKHFTGLPITAAALAMVAVNILFASPFAQKYFPLSKEMRAIISGCVLIVLGYFMVSRWKFPSAKALQFKMASMGIILIAVLFAIVVLYGVLYFFPILLTVTMWGYIILGWVLSLIRLIAGKKSNTLQGFEPEADDE